MSLIQLKSDLTKYKPDGTQNSEQKITLGNTKLTDINNNINKPGIDITNIKSTLAPNYSNLKPTGGDRDKNVKLPNYELSKDWMKQKEIYSYKSIFSIGEKTQPKPTGKDENTLTNKYNKSSRVIDISPIRNRDNKGVTFLQSKYDVKFVTDTLPKSKESNVIINKVEYDLDDYKSDVILNDIKQTTVLNSTILNRKIEYNLSDIDYSIQSVKLNNRINISNPEIDKTSANIDTTRFNDIRFNPLISDDEYKKFKLKLNKLSDIDLTDEKQFNSILDVGKRNDSVLFTENDKKSFPVLDVYNNIPINEVIPREINTRQRFSDLTKLDSLFDEIISTVIKTDLTNKRYFNSDFDYDLPSGVSFFSDRFQTNFTINQLMNDTKFIFKFQSRFSFGDEIPTVNTFRIRIPMLQTYYDINNSDFSNINNFTSNVFKDTNAIGFTLQQQDTKYLFDSTDYRWKQNKIPNVNYIDISNEFSNQFVLRQRDTQYNFESTDLRWKSNNIPSVNYFDTLNQYQDGLKLNPEHFISNYVSNSSKLTWKDDKIPAVNYIDRSNQYQEGLNLRPRLLETKYKTDASDLVWKNDLVNSVNHIDINNFYQRGFVLKTQMFRSYYRKDISKFDFDGSSFDAPNTDYFDRNKRNSQSGFKNFTLPLASDYIKDSSLYDFDGESSNAPVVNYFDRIKTNTILGFAKFIKHGESDYVKDSSLYDYNGSSQSGPAVNYFDMNNKYHRGFNKFPIAKLTHYVNNVSEFVWKNNNSNIPEMNFIDVKRFNTKTGFKRLIKHGESDYKFDSTSLRWKGRATPSMNFFDNKNQTNFRIRQTHLSTLYKTQTSKLSWVNDKVPVTNYFDVSYQNQLGFTRAVKFGDTEYKIESSQFSFRDNANNYFTPNEIDGFDLKFTDATATKFKIGLSTYDDLDKLKYSSEIRYSINSLDSDFSNFKDEAKYLSLFRRESQLFVSDFKKKDSEIGIDYFTNSIPGSTGFFTKRIDKTLTDFKLVDLIKKNDFFLSPIPYDNNNKYEVNNSEYNLSPKFRDEFKKIYTKLGNIRDIAHNTDLLWNEPYIIRGLNNPDALGPQPYGIFGASYDEGMVRGGILTYANRVFDDVQRVGKALTSGKGLMFMLRQFLIQRTNPNVETYPPPSTGSGVADTFLGAVGDFLFGRPTQFFNPLNTLLSAKGIYGPLFRRHSLDVLSGDSIVLGRYGEIVDQRNKNSSDRTQLKEVPTPTLASPSGTDNRLLQLTKELFPDWLMDGFQQPGAQNMFSNHLGSRIDRLSGISGPNSFFGLGTTIHRRYEVTNRQYNDTRFSTTSGAEIITMHRYTSDRQFASFDNDNRDPRVERTRSTDNSGNTADYDLLTYIIDDLEAYDKTISKFDIKDTFNTVKNPFKTINGVLGGTKKNEYDDYKIMQARAKDRRDNRSNVRPTGSFEAIFKPDAYIPTSSNPDYVTSNTFLVTNSSPETMGTTVGSSISMRYDDIQVLAKNLRENRAKYKRGLYPGGFSLLKELTPSTFKDRYGMRLNMINQLYTFDGDMSKSKTYASMVEGFGRQGSSYDNDGAQVDRSKPYWFSFPKSGGNDKLLNEWNKNVIKKSRGDKINLIDVITKANIKQYTKDNFKTLMDANKNIITDSIPLMFATANYNQLAPNDTGNYTILIFRCMIQSLTDGFTANWGSSKVMGRGDDVFMYEGFSRTTSLEFKVYASTLEEQFTNYRKLNELASMTAPDYGESGNGRMMGPVMRLTLGDLYVGVPILITAVSYTFDFTSGVELAGFDDKGKDVGVTKGVLRLPSMIDVSVSITILGNYRPEKGGRMYELKNQSGTNWYRKSADYKPTNEELALQKKSSEDLQDDDTSAPSTAPPNAPVYGPAPNPNAPVYGPQPNTGP